VWVAGLGRRGPGRQAGAAGPAGGGGRAFVAGPTGPGVCTGEGGRARRAGDRTGPGERAGTAAGRKGGRARRDWKETGVEGGGRLFFFFLYFFFPLFCGCKGERVEERTGTGEEGGDGRFLGGQGRSTAGVAEGGDVFSMTSSRRWAASRWLSAVARASKRTSRCAAKVGPDGLGGRRGPPWFGHLRGDTSARRHPQGTKREIHAPGRAPGEVP